MKLCVLTLCVYECGVCLTQVPVWVEASLLVLDILADTAPKRTPAKPAGTAAAPGATQAAAGEPSSSNCSSNWHELHYYCRVVSGRTTVALLWPVAMPQYERLQGRLLDLTPLHRFLYVYYHLLA